MTETLELGLENPLLPFPRVYRSPTSGSPGFGDTGGGFNYVFSVGLAIAVNTALATRRPLLLRGAPGNGKSTLARAVAKVAGRPFLSKVITSDSRLDDLLWRYDYVRRLQDGSSPAWKQPDGSEAPGRLREDYEYVEPQALWWALAPRAAMGRGRPGRVLERPVKEPSTDKPLTDPPVLLLDEIDKADPALPNDLLVAVGEGRFRIRETGEEVVAEHLPLIVITTNGERELSRPFVRRCIVADLAERKGETLIDWLKAIGEAHFAGHERLSPKFLEQVARVLVEKSQDAPNAAEFVDLVRACLEFGVDTSHAKFETLRQLVTSKARGRAETGV